MDQRGLTELKVIPVRWDQQVFRVRLAQREILVCKDRRVIRVLKDFKGHRVRESDFPGLKVRRVIQVFLDLQAPKVLRVSKV